MVVGSVLRVYGLSMLYGGSQVSEHLSLPISSKWHNRMHISVFFLLYCIAYIGLDFIFMCARHKMSLATKPGIEI